VKLSPKKNHNSFEISVLSSIDLSQRFIKNQLDFSEVNIFCTIVLFENNHISTIAENFEIVGVRLFGIEEKSRVGIYLTYNIPSCIIQKLNWLKKGSVIKIEYAEVRRYDRIHDIIEISKGDHTAIKKCQSESGIPSTVIDDESARFSAIVGCRSEYNSTICVGNLEYCERKAVLGVYLFIPTVQKLLNSTGYEEITAVCVDGDEIQFLVNLTEHHNFLSEQMDAKYSCPQQNVRYEFQKVVYCDVLYQESVRLDAEGEYDVSFRIITITRCLTQ
jgi:hypothetical protein